MSAAALKRKISGGPLQENFEHEDRGIDAKQIGNHGYIRVTFQPFTLTQTTRMYTKAQRCLLGKHQIAWLVDAKLPN